MSRFLAHAITRREPGGPATGLRGQPLRWIGTAELGVWVTVWAGDPVLTRDDAFAHHDLVAVLCEAGPCLPVRFGTWLASEAAARTSLDDGEARFAAAVDRLGERREIAVTLLWRDAPSEPGRGHAVAPSGRAFLDRKRAAHAVTDERRRIAAGLAADLARDLAVEQADVRHETCPSAEVALSLSLLARKDEAGALKARAMAAVADLGGVRGVVSGPWPPYSFTEELGAAAGAGVDRGS